MGYTGVMLDESGTFRGILHVCRDPMASYFGGGGLKDLDPDQWPFEEPVQGGDTRTVAIGAREQLLSALPEGRNAVFFGGTQGRPGGTYPLTIALDQLGAIEPGDVVYSRPKDAGSELVTTTLHDFVDLSCEPFV